MARLGGTPTARAKKESGMIWEWAVETGWVLGLLDERGEEGRGAGADGKGGEVMSLKVAVVS